MLILFGLLLYSQDRRRWNKRLGYAGIIGLMAMTVLMQGGVLGLPPVESDKWGGLPLTLLLAVFALTAAYPLGVLLALGRQSRMPAIKLLCVVYIEVIRGVPLISLLFMASIIFPLFLPEGVNIDKIVRAQAAIILFTAAYIAEVVRGGLQAMARGQYEAAQSIGLNYYLTMRLIILPQALKIVIPPSVSILISAFKDTSLVVIIALVRPAEDHPDRHFQSGVDGFQPRGVFVYRPSIFPGLFFHVQLQPQAGEGAVHRALTKTGSDPQEVIMNAARSTIEDDSRR